MSKKLMKVLWKDLQVGDEFAEDGAIVRDIFPWQKMKCFSVETDEGTIVMSETHLFAMKGTSYVDKNTGEIIPFANINMTQVSKNQTFKQCLNWISVGDAFTVFKVENEDYAECESLFGKVRITLYNGGEEQNVRCIETTTGTFTINGLLLGNSARGEHSITEMRDIVIDMLRGGMSQQWISKHLFLEPAAINRFAQLGGISAAFNTESGLVEAWDPVQDGINERRKKINITNAARRYVRKYRELRGMDTTFGDESVDIIEAALHLGFDENDPNMIPKTLDSNGRVFEKEYNSNEAEISEDKEEENV